MPVDPSIATRRTLLSRLKRCEDQQGWQEFFALYHSLIYRIGLKAGLIDAEAQDLVQEVMIIVARKLPDFQYDPARGSFKSWLLLITRRRIDKLLKRRLPIKSPKKGDDHTARTATIDRVADPNGITLESAWDAEWEKNLWDVALARVKTQFKPKQFQIFDLYVLKEWSVKEVARALSVSATNVYVTKHRIAGSLKREIARLQKA